ncbi:polyunsaturated fatty acid lipoxygenase ALOX8-like isoform X2 [Corythoichthys intestinalis]|uniref:polyunsaturated fatty acid lipoxygenase ALOX8-like isoform X2 n=1 Tax=Corythoichthys intestinalis TaxID=161448 RepID=UPI0025A4E3B9|nr:polyunsaturated fatty acid lipoxygenase ALOX8-like isoform X2 [Corythoichthys intestinalis]
MAEYTLTLTTGDMLDAGTFSNVFVSLVGTEGQSNRTQLTSTGLGNETGKVGRFSVTTAFTLGFLLLLQVEKDPFHELEDEWFCSTAVVRTPEDDDVFFPCYNWLSSGEIVVLRGGRATKAYEDYLPLLEEQRKKELVQQKLTYKWDEYAEGMAFILNIKDPNSLPAEVRYSYSKAREFAYRVKFARDELLETGLLNNVSLWEDFESMKNVSWFTKSTVAELVSQLWKKDDFFAYQFLNGVNPFLIRRYSKLQSNFPVTEEMVKPFLANGTTLAKEMENGNIFIVDYKLMEGLPTTVLDGKRVPLTPALCLLYMSPEKKLLPIAIQLGQQPSKDNPIFLPNDSEADWLLAKLHVRHVDTLQCYLVEHLQNTHLIAEVFAMATLRNLPMVHPLHKLLMPHHRGTLYVNTLARTYLYGPGRTFDITSISAEAQLPLLRKALSQLTYTSLCPPDDIAARGLESIPNYYYRDDALRMWNVIHSFVKAVVTYYYPLDIDVSADLELQEWVNEIFNYAFLGNAASGFPSTIENVEGLIKYVTMMIFTTSERHTSVNMGQIDYQNWIPNGPVLLHLEPPTIKGNATMDDILLTLPNKSTGSRTMSVIWLLSEKYDDFVPLGQYPQRFSEPAVLRMIEDFQAELSTISDAIDKRNEELQLPYPYLNPRHTENSVTI